MAMRLSSSVAVFGRPRRRGKMEKQQLAACFVIASFSARSSDARVSPRGTGGAAIDATAFGHYQYASVP
jgi:hypothetical protein